MKVGVVSKEPGGQHHVYHDGTIRKERERDKSLVVVELVFLSMGQGYDYQQQCTTMNESIYSRDCEHLKGGL